MTSNKKLKNAVEVTDRIQKHVIHKLGEEVDDVIRAGNQAIAELEATLSLCPECNCMTNTTISGKCRKCEGQKESDMT